MNLLNDDGVPVGFGMGLAQDMQALQKYSSMSEKEKRDVIEGARKTKTREEMTSYISHLHD